MNKALGTIGIALVALAVGACTESKPVPAAGMANPASVYCEKVGGKLRIEKTSQGEQGVCVLPNGTEIEEWALFRRDHPEKAQK